MKAKPESITARAQLTWPVARTRHRMKAYGEARVAKPAAIYLSAALETIVREILSQSIDVLGEDKARISARTVRLAINQDVDLRALLSAVHVYNGGVPPDMEDTLRQRKRDKADGIVDPKREAKRAKRIKDRKKRRAAD